MFVLQLGLQPKQELNTKLHMTCELRQSIELLQLPAQELAAFLQEQSYENPLIEIEWTIDSAKNRKKTCDRRKDRNDDLLGMVPDRTSMTLEYWVNRQLRMIPYSRDLYRAVMYLAGNLDDSGYLEVSLTQAAADIHLPEGIVAEALQTLQSFDPAGIGARSLQECLTLQIGRDLEAPILAHDVVVRHLQELAKNRYADIAKCLHVSNTDVQEAAAYIRGLNPKPCASIPHEQCPNLAIDAYVWIVDERVEVALNERVVPKISIQQEYVMNFRHEAGTYAEYFRRNLKSANWLIDSLAQRNATLRQVIMAIVEEQRDFFAAGGSRLVPLTLKQVAERIGKHESTVSRTIKYKAIHTPRGIYELKDFFGNGLETDGGVSVSATAVRKRIKEMIDRENKTTPLSDQQISTMLESEGIRISRRTVAKYREEMRILTAVMRRHD